jgi:hypothetical protein
MDSIHCDTQQDANHEEIYTYLRINEDDNEPLGSIKFKGFLGQLR